jgi:hypothetical protein
VKTTSRDTRGTALSNAMPSSCIRECDGFQHGKSAVPFVQMKNARRDAHGFEGAEPSHAKQQFLPDASPRVSAIEAGSEFPVVRGIAFHIGIEEKQVAASNRTRQTLA